MRTKDILELDLIKIPLITIDDSLDKYINDQIPQKKIDECNDSLEKTNLPSILDKIRKRNTNLI